LGGGFLAVAVGQFLAVGVQDFPHLGAGSQYDVAARADATSGVGDLFPQEPGPHPVGLQDRGEGDTGGGAPPTVLSGFRGGRGGDAAEAAQDGLDLRHAGGSEGLEVDDPF
jgi:hypothetical protein